jgi:hypothetical protein
VLRVNLHPALVATQAAFSGMKAGGWGRINARQRRAYQLCRGQGRTRKLHAKLGAGIGCERHTVNAVAPGSTETELFRANNAPGSEGEARYLAGVPMRRFGNPEEIAAAIAFLLSDDAAFMTGQTLHVDGGASIGKLFL